LIFSIPVERSQHAARAQDLCRCEAKFAQIECRQSKHRSKVVTGLPHTQCESDFCRHTTKQSPHTSNGVIGHNPIQTPFFTASQAQIALAAARDRTASESSLRAVASHPRGVSRHTDTRGGERRRRRAAAVPAHTRSLTQVQVADPREGRPHVVLAGGAEPVAPVDISQRARRGSARPTPHPYETTPNRARARAHVIRTEGHTHWRHSSLSAVRPCRQEASAAAPSSPIWFSLRRSAAVRAEGGEEAHTHAHPVTAHAHTHAHVHTFL
jgi:hypothetical protein